MQQMEKDSQINPKQMLERLPIAFQQVKTGNTSVNLLNEIHQIMHFLYQAKEMKIVTHLNLIDLYSIFQLKQTLKRGINMLIYEILPYIHGQI